jgi:hypothetical protein
MQNEFVFNGTEVFDLFGESGFCSICQVNLEEGERVRAISKCQHLFHSPCLEPWLDSHNTCPLCRITITETVTPTNAYLTNLLTFIEERIQNFHVQLRRNLFQFCLAEGILKKFPTAAAMQPHLAAVRTCLQEQIIIDNLVSVRIDITNRTQLMRHLGELRRELHRSNSTRSRIIQSWAEYREYRERLQHHGEQNAVFLAIWV